MTHGGKLDRMFSFRRGRVVIVQQPGALTEPQLNAALAVAEDTAIWKAVLQLIATAEENANRNAQDSLDPPTVLAGYVGGASHLRMLRDELIDRREQGIKELGERRMTE